jgi:hypothetical protein
MCDRAEGALGIPEQEAADACGVSLRASRRWELATDQRGRREKLVCFAQKYNLSYEWLLAGKRKIIRPAA